ncbi:MULTISPECIES: metal-dependent hydrolase [Sphingobacterium]|uniref:metal-dependent hydrolase n=1 Tax=Sphingobacterium TaxID=28453 RepID=UPI001F08B179|nr:MULTISPECIES: metal-dependent hydrolase [unclassified Sphingobacterium]
MSNNSVSARYLGQSCVEFDFNGTKVLLDPFVSFNPMASGVDINTLRPSYIFLSHAHQDHVADMFEIQKNSDATVSAIVETAAWVRRQGISEDKVIEFNFGGTLSLPFGKVKMVYALHTNSTPDGEYAGVPCGFVFFVGDKKIYFAGDTALTLEMKLLEDLELDWAFLPIGGYYTMDMYDAVKAARFINCKQIVGIHYNTFTPISINVMEAQDLFSREGVVLHLPALGETITL